MGQRLMCGVLVLVAFVAALSWSSLRVVDALGSRLGLTVTQTTRSAQLAGAIRRRDRGNARDGQARSVLPSKGCIR